MTAVIGFPVRAAFAITLCLTAALLAASSRESRADFRVCNSTGAQVKLAFGHNDTSFGWTSRGWWTLPANGCQNVLSGDIPRGNYYVYTLDNTNRPIAVPDAQTGGTFCLKDENFDLRSSGYLTPQNTIACEAHGLKAAKFRVVEVADAVPNYSYSLAPNAMGGGGLSALIPLIKEAAQNLERPATPSSLTPAPPVAVMQTPTAQRPATPSGTACQRYPNLC